MNLQTSNQPAGPSRRSFLRAGVVGGAVVGVGGLSTLLTACGAQTSKSAASVTAAQVQKATGSVDVLTFSFYQPKALNAGKVKAHYSTIGSADEILAKIRSRSTELGVINSGANIMREMYAVDRLMPITTDAMAHYSDLEPTLRENPVFSKDGKVYAIPFAVSPGLCAWDSAKVPEPKTADQLVSSDYRNQIAFYDDAEALLMIFRAMGGDILNFTHDDLRNVLAYMEDLRPNIRTLYTFGQEVDLLGRGDVSVAFVTFGALLTSAQQGNSTIKGNFLGSTSYVDCWSVADGADPAAALSWIDNAISPTGQAALQAASGGYPAAPAETDFKLLPSELDNISIADWLKISPIATGVPVEEDGNKVTRPELQKAWNQYKAKF